MKDENLNDAEVTESNETELERVQRELEVMVREKFGDNVHIVGHEISPQDLNQKLKRYKQKKNKDIKGDAPKNFELNFSYSPKEVVTYLDQFVIGQTEAKKALAIAVCDHYNHVKAVKEQSEKGQESLENYGKQNVLVLGPTGVGKTYLVKKVAQLIGVPFVKADATRFTQMGYVGANAEDMIRDLVSMANNQIPLAQFGIIYIDEVDKIASPAQGLGKDIAGRGVQNSLLKLMEETEIDLSTPTDMQSQFQALMDFQSRGRLDKKIINTKHILFIVSGAFAGLETIIQKRLRVRAIGLQAQTEIKHHLHADELFLQVSTPDLVEYGFEPEFIGRLPVRLSCQSLKVDDLYLILKDSKGSLIHQYTESFRAYGVEVTFEDEALFEIARLAWEEKTGARALMTVCEKIFRNYKYELSDGKIKALQVSKEMILNPEESLQKILNL